MRLSRLSRSYWVRWVIRCTLLAVLIGGCSTADDSITSPSRDAGYTTQADPSGSMNPSPAGVSRGKQIFSTTGCGACHAINGQGGSIGPDLSNEANKGRSRPWLITQIRNPKENAPQTTMPAYGTLPNADVNDLADYLLSLSTGKAAGAISTRAAASRAPSRSASPPAASSDIAEGGQMWAQSCGRCHNVRPPSQYGDAQWQVAVHHMRVRVPLTGEQQRKILEFLQATN